MGNKEKQKETRCEVDDCKYCTKRGTCSCPKGPCDCCGMTTQEARQALWLVRGSAELNTSGLKKIKEYLKRLMHGLKPKNHR